MSTERSDNVFFHQRAASEKFDYFVTGITGALCAYISQTYTPSKLSVSPGTLELLALLFLVGSVIAGFKRIETSIMVYRYNAHTLRLQEERGQLASNSAGGHMLNTSTGDVLSREEVFAKLRALTEALPESHKKTEDTAITAGTWYKVRNNLLVIGFLALLASKVWSAYT
jgi:hypothetical protein